MLKNNKLALVASNNKAQNQVQNFDMSIFEVIDNQINLTKMASFFGKEIKEWLKLPSAKKYLKALTESEGGKSPIGILKGGAGEQGTFGTREVALKVAQWISPEFEVFCIKKLDTLFQTGKVELKPKLPVNSLEAAEMLANQVIMLVAKVKQGQAELKEKEATVKAQQEVITSQNDTHVSLINLKAREFKTVHSAVKADIGKEINHYVRELYLKQAGGDYRKAHQIARKEFNWDTGEEYLGAKLTSLETKKVYLKWLRGQILANKNQLQLA